MSKYGAKKVTYDGKTFDSKKEAQRYAELRLLERGKVIKDLKCQVKYPLLLAQYEKGENGKLLERGVTYVADFAYTDCKTGERIVEDTKGVKTEAYIIKRKLMLYFYGIRIKEV